MRHRFLVNRSQIHRIIPAETDRNFHFPPLVAGKCEAFRMFSQFSSEINQYKAARTRKCLSCADLSPTRRV